MHHEHELSEEIRAATRDWVGKLPMVDPLEEFKLGPTGRFPGGKLTPNDEGEIKVGIGKLKGKVVVNFGKPIASLGFSVEQARDVALALRQQADLIKRGGR